MELERLSPVFQTIHSPVKLLKFNALAVAVGDPLGFHEGRERRFILYLAELRHDMALMVWVEVDHARHHKTDRKLLRWNLDTQAERIDNAVL